MTTTEHEKYEAETIATTVEGKTVTIAELKAAFETFAQHGEHWKLPNQFAVPADLFPLVSAACEFYLATPAKIAKTSKRMMPGYVFAGHDGYKA